MKPLYYLDLEMTVLLKRLGVVVPIVTRKFLKFIDPHRFLISLTHNDTPRHTSVTKTGPSLMRVNFYFLPSLGIWKEEMLCLKATKIEQGGFSHL